MINLFFYRHNKKGYAQEIPPSKINFYELTLVLKGSLLYEINGQSYVIGQNDGIFIKSGDVRRRDETEGADYVSFNFYGFDGNLPTYLPKTVNNTVKLLAAVCDEIHEKIYDGDKEMSLAVELILSVVADTHSASLENPVVLAIKQYIHADLAQKINLSDLAAEVGYSPNYCATLFKKHTGLSIIEYLNAERVEEAKRLINENILSLQQIAYTVGFEDYNYFARTFKKAGGYSPTDYKRLIQRK